MSTNTIPSFNSQMHSLADASLRLGRDVNIQNDNVREKAIESSMPDAETALYDLIRNTKAQKKLAKAFSPNEDVAALGRDFTAERGQSVIAPYVRAIEVCSRLFSIDLSTMSNKARCDYQRVVGPAFQLLVKMFAPLATLDFK